MRRFSASILSLLLGFGAMQAQSIYSFEGLGSLEHQGMPNNYGMGEVGIGTPTIWHVNSQNPANLVYNTFSTFQLGLEVENRRFTGEDISGDDTNGALRFLAYAFPVMAGKWSSSFGILPYSSVNYNTFSEGPVDGDNSITQTADNRGEGGLTSLYWANGFRITKNLLVGLRTNYTFGSIDKESVISLSGTGLPTNTSSFDNQESYSDLNFQFGLAYRIKITEKKFWNFGATYSPSTDFNGTSRLSLSTISSGSEINEREVSNTSIDRKLPQTFGLGASYQKINNITIGLDWELQEWKNVARPNDAFDNFSKIALGIDWIPDFDDVNSYFQRARYAFGVNRTRLPYVVNGQSLTDFGINFGASFPVSGFSSVDVAFKIGQLGESGNGLIRENYFKVVLGATINDRWFIKRRYD
ncbi:MAG: hypothetical protein AAF616_09515 [Bacteroidota bacterium]